LLILKIEMPVLKAKYSFEKPLDSLTNAIAVNSDIINDKPAMLILM
jgi:hypothetical protein